ncbi:hypothetical protein [Methyloraptor flagellatus]|uniref:Uncharacterized protein n=1 Tax=Methyloraptor flagellatus TaxID=3162530 RepID=A0AAU7XBZ5_9HYPH
MIRVVPQERFKPAVADLIRGARSVEPPTDYPGALYLRADDSFVGIRATRTRFVVEITRNPGASRSLDALKFFAADRPTVPEASRERIVRVTDYLDELPWLVEHDEPVSFRQLINEALFYFEMTQKETINYAQHALVRLLQAGAIPCRPSNDAVLWRPDWRYGSDRGTIHERIMLEWMADLCPRLPFWTGVWLGLPRDVPSERSL